MRSRSTNPVVPVLAALVLALAAFSPVVAQEPSASPELSPQPSAERVEDSRAELAAARELRKAAREERKVARDERKAERAAKRATAKAERAAVRELRKALLAEQKAQREADREQRKAARAERKASVGEARAACREELEGVRAATWADRAERKTAWGEAKSACREAIKAAVAGTSFHDEAEPMDTYYTDAVAGELEVVRTDLGLAQPGSAPGQELGLRHYLIPVDAELAPHTHPGWQLARVTAGELEYTVVEGEGVLLRADGSSQAMGPGTYVLATGDGVIENPDLVHLGANRTDDSVTIISATLFEAGAPIATAVEGEE